LTEAWLKIDRRLVELWKCQAGGASPVMRVPGAVSALSGVGQWAWSEGFSG